MHDTLRVLSSGTALETTSSRVVTPIAGLGAVTVRSCSAEELAFSRRDTPLLPASFPARSDSRATLTILTGLQAGRLVACHGASVTIGRAPDADLVVDDTGVSRYHARIARSGEGAFYAEDLGSTNGTYLRTLRVGVARLREGDVLQLGPELRVRFAVLDTAQERLHQQLYESSVHDPLTHAFNRKYLNDRLIAEVAHARRARSELAIMMIDVDCLKEVNDRFGHLAGDRALCTIASRIRSVLRVEDVLARYGGDEFVVIAAGTTSAEAVRLAERIRRTIGGLRMSARGREVRITSSIGVASAEELEPTDDPVAALLAVADARMYTAKVSGRDRVCATDVTPG
jgi:diguanylate cyclase (GGDEF)-like protein